MTSSKNGIRYPNLEFIKSSTCCPCPARQFNGKLLLIVYITFMFFVCFHVENSNMESDDIIYVSLLVFTIVFGYFFRRLNDIALKKNTSAIIGFLIVLFLSGSHVFHSIACILVNSVIILKINKRLCHIYSFIFSFLYLLFFRSTIYFGLSYPPAHTNLIQMLLTLKIVGLAFEVRDSNNFPLENAKEFETNVRNKEASHLNFKDIIYYSYCYIGILTGPYYSYKTFNDYFKTDFHKYASCESTTLKKLLLVPLYAVVFLISSHYYPVKYAESEEFYTETSFWYRLWYMSPVFVSFRMRIYVGLVLSEAACTIAGLGAYPEETKPQPGKGPSVNFKLLETLKTDSFLQRKSSYNFDTVHNINIWYTETDPSVRSSIHYWNMCVQYWMVYVVYKRFPFKALRTVATFGVSALWHGVYAGYYLCLCSVPFYLPIEDIWESLLRKKATGNKRLFWNIIFWIVRTQAFTYMGMAFSLLSMRNVLRYYGSIYYIYHVTSLIGLGLGLILRIYSSEK